MIMERLVKVFSSRAFYIFFSLLVAFAIWVYVQINVNEEVETPINAAVVFRNDEVLGDRNLFISEMSSDTVALNFSSPRNVATALLREGVTVVLDLAQVNTTGHVHLSYDIVIPPTVDQRLVELRSRSTYTITLLIDRLSSKSIPVRAVYTGGTASEEFFADPPQLSPDTIEVIGPATVLATIYYAWVPIVRENLVTTYIADLPLVIMDYESEALTSELLDLLTLSQSTIQVTVPVRMQRDIVLIVHPSYGAGATETNTIININPQTITVAGDPEMLVDLNTITLRTIDLTSFGTSYAWTFPIPLDNELINMTGVTEATVTAEVIGLSLRHLSVTSLHVANTPTGYTAEILTQSADITIRGRAEDLEEIGPMDIRVVADISTLTPGTTRVPARVYIDGVGGNVGAIGTTSIFVSLSSTED